MCGVFGFLSGNGRGPDVDRLRRVALVTQTRGDHAFGLAWVDEGGAIGTFKRPGPAADWLGELDCCRHAVAVIGHCRFATHGRPADNRNNHPHAAGRGVIVHNGIVENASALVARFGLTPRSACDSEVIGLLLARSAGLLVQRAARVAGQVSGGLAVLGLWRSPARMLIVRRGRPLHLGTAAEGHYLASLPAGLPGPARSIADDSACVLAFADGRLREGGAIRLEADAQRGPELWR